MLFLNQSLYCCFLMRQIEDIINIYLVDKICVPGYAVPSHMYKITLCIWFPYKYKISLLNDCLYFFAQNPIFVFEIKQF